MTRKPTFFKICRNCGKHHAPAKRRCKCGGNYFDTPTPYEVSLHIAQNNEIEAILDRLTKGQ